MQNIHAFLYSVAILMFASVIALASFNESHLNVYFTFFAISYFVSFLAFVPSVKLLGYLSIAVFLLWALVAATSVI
jgi:hypothetical protein